MPLLGARNLTNSPQEPFAFVKLRRLCQMVRFHATVKKENYNGKEIMREEKRGLSCAAPLDGMSRHYSSAHNSAQPIILIGGADV